MSRRTTISVRQISRISRFFGLQPAGVSFASQMDHLRFVKASRLVSVLVAALSCGGLGGCIVTNAEDFPEEQQVPPILLDSPALPLGSIIPFDPRNESMVPLRLTVRDDNLDDVLQLQVEVTAIGQQPKRFCPDIKIPAGDDPVREQVSIAVDRTMIYARACNRVVVFVSRDFANTCTDDDSRGFGVPAQKNDLGKAQFWIWDMSGDPTSNGDAALGLTTTCSLATRTTATTSTTSMPMGQ
jgi:hypothetical protein